VERVSDWGRDLDAQQGERSSSDTPARKRSPIPFRGARETNEWTNFSNQENERCDHHSGTQTQCANSIVELSQRGREALINTTRTAMKSKDDVPYLQRFKLIPEPTRSYGDTKTTGRCHLL